MGYVTQRWIEHPLYEVRVNGVIIAKTKHKAQAWKAAEAEAHSLFHNNKVEVINDLTGEITDF